jgi:hypothetical protein
VLSNLEKAQFEPLEAVHELLELGTTETLAQAEYKALGRMLRGYDDVEDLDSEAIKSLVGLVDNSQFDAYRQL